MTLNCIVSVLHQNEGGIGKSIPDAQEISRDPRDFPRAKPEGNLEGLVLVEHRYILVFKDHNALKVKNLI